MSQPLITIDQAQIGRDIAALGAKMAQYQRASGKTPEQVLRKQSNNLAIFLSSPRVPGELKKLAPAKGVIRSTNISRMRAGHGGLKIGARARRMVYMGRGIVQDISSRRSLATGRRGKVYKKGPKGVNVQQLLVKKELALRSSASSFLAYGSRFSQVKMIEPGQVQATENKVGRFLTDATMVSDRNGTVVTLFGNVSRDLLRGLTQPRSRAAIHQAFQVAIADMDVYLARKQAEALKAARLT